MARRVRDLIRSRLLAGEFGEDRLPDDEQLMHDYRVGRNAVRRALTALQVEGLIERKQGTGTFPGPTKSFHHLANALGFAASITSPWLRMGSRLITSEEVTASPELARELGVVAGTTCLAVDAVTVIDGVPAVLLTSYVADTVAQVRIREAIRVGVWPGDWYDLLTVAGLGARRREMLVEAVAIDDLVAPFLQVPPGSPAIRFQRRLELGPDAVPEYGFSYCRGDLLTFGVRENTLDPAPVRRQPTRPGDVGRWHSLERLF